MGVQVQPQMKQKRFPWRQQANLAIHAEGKTPFIQSINKDSSSSSTSSTLKGILFHFFRFRKCVQLKLRSPGKRFLFIFQVQSPPFAVIRNPPSRQADGYCRHVSVIYIPLCFLRSRNNRYSGRLISGSCLLLFSRQRKNNRSD